MNWPSLMILLIPMCVNGTFFTSLLSPRSPILSPRYRSRTSRSPTSNLIQLQSPILGLRFSVPAGLMNLLGFTPPYQPQQQTIPLNGALLALLRSLMNNPNYNPNYGNQPSYRPPERFLPPNIVLKISPEYFTPHSHSVPPGNHPNVPHYQPPGNHYNPNVAHGNHYHPHSDHYNPNVPHYLGPSHPNVPPYHRPQSAHFPPQPVQFTPQSGPFSPQSSYFPAPQSQNPNFYNSLPPQNNIPPPFNTPAQSPNTQFPNFNPNFNNIPSNGNGGAQPFNTPFAPDFGVPQYSQRLPPNPQAESFAPNYPIQPRSPEPILRFIPPS